MLLQAIDAFIGGNELLPTINIFLTFHHYRVLWRVYVWMCCVCVGGGRLGGGRLGARGMVWYTAKVKANQFMILRRYTNKYIICNGI